MSCPDISWSNRGKPPSLLWTDSHVTGNTKWKAETLSTSSDFMEHITPIPSMSWYTLCGSPLLNMYRWPYLYILLPLLWMVVCSLCYWTIIGWINAASLYVLVCSAFALSLDTKTGLIRTAILVVMGHFAYQSGVTGTNSDAWRWIILKIIGTAQSTTS